MTSKIRSIAVALAIALFAFASAAEAAETGSANREEEKPSSTQSQTAGQSYTAETPTSGLLLPAVQAAREAARRCTCN